MGEGREGRSEAHGVGRRKEEGSSRPGAGACLWSVGFVCAREWIGAVVVVQVGREGGREGGRGRPRSAKASTRTNTQHRRQALVEHSSSSSTLCSERAGKHTTTSTHSEGCGRAGVLRCPVSCRSKVAAFRATSKFILGARAGEAKVAVGTRKRA